VFGHAARFHPIKNHEGALRAYMQLAADRPDVWLVMVGEGVDGESSGLHAIANSFAHNERILLLGNEKCMEAFYNGIDVCVLSSWAEAMPNVIGEAMACGTPCISTDVGDASALMGDTGWIASQPTPIDLQRAMAAAYEAGAAGLRAKGASARARIALTYSLEAMVREYGQLYRSLT
jgi:glycosyltransferase involved in cell wall biosynthesis